MTPTDPTGIAERLEDLLHHPSLRPEWCDATGFALWEKVRDCRFRPDPDDPDDLRQSFGYEHMVVSRRARRWLRAAHPDWGSERVEQAVSHAYEAWGQQNPSLREIQAVDRVFAAAEAENRWRDGVDERGVFLTRPELEHLLEVIGDNHPISAAIREKARRALDRGGGG